MVEYSNIQITWEGQDGSLNYDWVNEDTDILHYLSSIQSYGGVNIRVFYEDVEVDNKLLGDFSNNLSGLSATFRELVLSGRASVS